MIELLTGEFLPITMVLAGFIIGLFAIVFLGSMFLSLPLFQLIFPGAATVGPIVGAIKVGSVSRGLFSTATTWKSINFTSLPKYYALFFGSVIGAIGISSVRSEYTIFVVILAILVTMNTRHLVELIKNSTWTKHMMIAGVGLYGGFFGAGISYLILPIMRVIEPRQYGADDKIIETRIQALFIEFLIALVAITGHIVAGTISLSNWNMWVWWALGSALAGVVGGLLLEKNRNADAMYQRMVLYLSFVIAILVAIIVRLNV